MLLNDYADNGRLFNSNFTGESSTSGVYAYRGDLVIEGDFESPANERRPPKTVMAQVAMLADASKIKGMIGALQFLETLDQVLSLYGPDLAEDAVCMFFVRDIPQSLVLEVDGRKIFLESFDDTLIWNEALDLLAIEKGDIKKLSPEDKVAFLVDEMRNHRSRGKSVDWSAALEQRVDKAPLDRVGAI